mgnify:CR=1 FL=1|jgi:hypothetical protein
MRKKRLMQNIFQTNIWVFENTIIQIALNEKISK